MNILVGMVLVVYYAMIALTFGLMPDVFLASDGYEQNLAFNSSTVNQAGELDRGGFFSTGVSFTRFAFIVFTGIGLPAELPTAFLFVFAIWQITVLILGQLWFWSSVWNG